MLSYIWKTRKLTPERVNLKWTANFQITSICFWAPLKIAQKHFTKLPLEIIYVFLIPEPKNIFFGSL